MSEFIGEKNKQAEAQMSHDSESSPPPPPYSAQAGNQVFDVDYTNWVSDIYVRDATGTELFAGHRDRASSEVAITDRNKTLIANTKASGITTKITVEMLGASGAAHTFEIHNHATVGSPRYNSPSFSGQQMTWKNKLLSKKILFDLTDEAGNVYVKFASDPKTKIGRVEVTDDCIANGRLNEIMVTLLTLLTRKLRNANDVPQYGIVN